MTRLTSTDPDDMTPPPKLHKKLMPPQIEKVRRWIAEGAEYQGHWAFLKPERVALSVATGNPIDGFILQKLTAQGLKPSPEAPKETLIRRVTLDLTGLPPTSEEVAAFLQDAAPDASEHVVDRLLKSRAVGRTRRSPAPCTSPRARSKTT